VERFRNDNKLLGPSSRRESLNDVGPHPGMMSTVAFQDDYRQEECVGGRQRPRFKAEGWI
jgi:hypothetical protein